jgi:recombination protein RecA
VKSFVDAGHYAGYIDAEHTLGQEFVEEMIADIQNKPNFLGSRPSTYEETIEKVDGFLKKIGAARKTNPDLKSILVVDSINKLVPARELKKVLEEGKDRKGNDKGGGAELSKGHQGRYRAAVNQAWLDHLTPLLAEADCALCIIAQERDEEATSFFKKEDDVKVKGGKALLFDASMVIRVSKASPIYFKDSDKTNAGIAGFAHRVRVWKSKVGHMDGRHSDCVFYLSNGKFSKPGFDHAREALTMGVKLGLVNQSGAWFSYDGRRQQGMNSAIEYLNKNPERLVKLLSEVNNAIREKRPTT